MVLLDNNQKKASQNTPTISLSLSMITENMCVLSSRWNYGGALQSTAEQTGNTAEHGPQLQL